MSTHEQLDHEIRDPRLPSNEFIRKNRKLIGGDELLVNLTEDQALALFKYVIEKGIQGSGAGEMKVDTEGGKPAFYLGHTIGCHKPLFEALGIEG